MLLPTSATAGRGGRHPTLHFARQGRINAASFLSWETYSRAGGAQDDGEASRQDVRADRRGKWATRFTRAWQSVGAGEGNRTLVISLEGCCSTIELHPRRTAKSISATISIGKDIGTDIGKEIYRHRNRPGTTA